MVENCRRHLRITSRISPKLGLAAGSLGAREAIVAIVANVAVVGGKVEEFGLQPEGARANLRVCRRETSKHPVTVGRG